MGPLAQSFIFFIFTLAAAECLEYALKGHELYIKPPEFVSPEKIIWRHNSEGVVTFNGREQQEYGPYKGRVMLHRSSAELWIKDVRFEDRGEYELEAWFRNQPKKKMHYNIEVIAKVSINNVSCEMDGDQQAKLVCSADSSHPELLTFEWSFNGTQFPGSTLTIGLDQDDDRVFTCRVKDPASEAEATLAASKCFPEKKKFPFAIVIVVLGFVASLVLLVGGICLWRHTGEA